ncbi:hypothetical protein [Desnuesiella massiliensis]|uniref:hypothetical protein n=1 Tax=Desnuesiella massiliensis TaxID=1650662 RepID=UPI0006E43806|nr:hypothetical protein [Desnuesiella massiliensis]
MSIIVNEIKKIFNLKMVLMLIVINLLMYFLFIEFWIKYFPNGRPETDIYRISVEMKKNYGEYVDEEEFKDFKIKYEEKIREADEYIQSEERFIKADIKNYEQFKNIDRKIKSQSDLRDYTVFKESIDLFWELPTTKWMIQSYESKKEDLLRQYRGTTSEAKFRIEDVYSKNEQTSIMPYIVLENYNNLIKGLIMTILLSVMFMISPIYLRDSKNKVKHIQYTCRRGRKMFKSKIYAGLIGTFIINTLQLMIFFMLYHHNKVNMFFNSNINSFLNSRIIFWYDLTFIQYIILTVILIYILVFIFTLISMFVSSVVNNYIALIGIQLPIAIVTFNLIIEKLIIYFVSIALPKMIVPLCFLIAIILITAITVVRWKKERVVDVTN